MFCDTSQMQVLYLASDVFSADFAKERHIHKVSSTLYLLPVPVAELKQGKRAALLPVREETIDLEFLYSAAIDVPNLTLGPVNIPGRVVQDGLANQRLASPSDQQVVTRHLLHLGQETVNALNGGIGDLALLERAVHVPFLVHTTLDEVGNELRTNEVDEGVFNVEVVGKVNAQVPKVVVTLGGSA
jgi:hypothetical protein